MTDQDLKREKNIPLFDIAWRDTICEVRVLFSNNEEIMTFELTAFQPRYPIGKNNPFQPEQWFVPFSEINNVILDSCRRDPIRWKPSMKELSFDNTVLNDICLQQFVYFTGSDRGKKQCSMLNTIYNLEPPFIPVEWISSLLDEFIAIDGVSYCVVGPLGDADAHKSKTINQLKRLGTALYDEEDDCLVMLPRYLTPDNTYNMTTLFVGPSLFVHSERADHDPFSCELFIVNLFAAFYPFETYPQSGKKLDIDVIYNTFNPLSRDEDGPSPSSSSPDYDLDDEIPITMETIFPENGGANDNDPADSEVEGFSDSGDVDTFITTTNRDPSHTQRDRWLYVLIVFLTNSSLPQPHPVFQSAQQSPLDETTKFNILTILQKGKWNVSHENITQDISQIKQIVSEKGSYIFSSVMSDRVLSTFFISMDQTIVAKK